LTDIIALIQLRLRRSVLTVVLLFIFFHVFIFVTGQVVSAVSYSKDRTLPKVQSARIKGSISI